MNNYNILKHLEYFAGINKAKFPYKLEARKFLVFLVGGKTSYWVY